MPGLALLSSQALSGSFYLGAAMRNNGGLTYGRCFVSRPPPTTLQTEEQQQTVVREIFSLLSKRSDAVCNFLEGGRYV